jgi:hypothetical protein
MNREDLQALRIPLIVLGATLLVAVMLVFFSGTVLEKARDTRSKREAQLREARLRIQNAGDEKERIIRYVGTYEQLARAGLIGEEQRINWLDSLRMANQEARTLGIEYDIGAQKPYSYAAEFDAGKLLLQESVMRLKLRLLHEEDLPRFFASLARHGGGFFTVDECKLQRLTTKDARTPQVEANLAAECDVRWVTINPAPPAEKKK